MSDDIVEQLRTADIYDVLDADKLCCEAADEIEKLRAALNTFVAAVPKDCVLVSRVATEQMDARIVAFETEIEKLRAALQPFAGMAKYCEGDSDSYSVCVFVGDVRQARAALGEKE
jgi:hypothetical protein